MSKPVGHPPRRKCVKEGGLNENPEGSRGPGTGGRRQRKNMRSAQRTIPTLERIHRPDRGIGYRPGEKRNARHKVWAAWSTNCIQLSDLGGMEIMGNERHEACMGKDRTEPTTNLCREQGGTSKTIGLCRSAEYTSMARSGRPKLTRATSTSPLMQGNG